MRVVITGGAGFLGMRLARRLAESGSLRSPDGDESIGELILVDRQAPDPARARVPEGAQFMQGDITAPDFLAGLLGDGDVSVFHLAAIVSGHAEQDFDLAMRVNLDASRALLEALRHHPHRTRFVATSTLAVFGALEGAGDLTKQVPETTYGMTKAILELLIGDYTRKGFVDGRAARLPTVIIRPGLPNAAASSAASAVFREPLAGVDYTLPLPESTRMPVIGVDTVVESLVALHDLDSARLGADRTVTLAGFSATIAEMIESLQRVAGDRALGTITVEPRPELQAIVDTWPPSIDASRALALGLPSSTGLDDIVRDYIAEGY